MIPRIITAAIVVTHAMAVPVSAQTKDAFVRALLDFTSAVQGTYGDEGPLLTSSVEAMAAGLAEWDAVVGKMEAGLAADIGAAPTPVAARMRAALGAAYLERGRIEDSLRELGVAASLDPQFAAAHMLRGLAFEVAGRSLDAADAQRLAWRADRSDPVAAYRLARIELEGGTSTDAQEALMVLSRAVDDVSQRAGAAALALVSAGLVDEASVATPLFAPAPYAEAYRLFQRALYKEGIDALRTRIAADSLVTDPAVRAPEIKKALEALRHEQPANAVIQLSAVAEKWSKSSEFHRVLGTAYSTLRNYPKSAEHLRTAIGLNPLDERSRLLLADVLMAAQQPAAAADALGEAIRVLPQAGEAYWRLGRLRQTLGDERAAREAFEKASSLSTLAGIAHVHTAIARLSHNQLDLDAAALAYRKRIDVVPSDAAAHADLGDVYRAQDRLDAALAEFLIAALLDPTYSRALAGAGQIHAAAGRDSEAVRMLRKAVDLAPAQLEARYALSRALVRVGKTEEGAQELRTFQELQSKAMEEERRRYQDNLLKIEDELKKGAGTGQGR